MPRVLPGSIFLTGSVAGGARRDALAAVGLERSGGGELAGGFVFSGSCAGASTYKACVQTSQATYGLCPHRIPVGEKNLPLTLTAWKSEAGEAELSEHRQSIGAGIRGTASCPTPRDASGRKQTSHVTGRRG